MQYARCTACTPRLSKKTPSDICHPTESGLDTHSPSLQIYVLKIDPGNGERTSASNNWEASLLSHFDLRARGGVGVVSIARKSEALRHVDAFDLCSVRATEQKGGLAVVAGQCDAVSTRSQRSSQYAGHRWRRVYRASPLDGRPPRTVDHLVSVDIECNSDDNIVRFTLKIIQETA